MSAAILAGGRARRLSGRDKSRLIIDGQTIIHRQLDVLQRITPDIFIVSSFVSRYGDLPIPAYPDVVPASGAMGGLLTALERASSPLVLVIACDLPFLTRTLLQAVGDAAGTGDGAWVRSPRGIEPLVACYRRAVRFALRGEILAGRLALAGLGAVLRMTPVDVAEQSVFGASTRLLANVNTADDYDRLQ